MKTRPLYLCIMIPLFLSLLFGCGEKEKKAAPKVEEKEPEAEAVEPAREAEAEKEAFLLEGYITYLSGDVFLKSGTEWNPCDIDEFIGIEDMIKTEPESFCEVQFTDLGIIRIQESTEVAMRDIYLKEEQNRVNVKLIEGDLLCKVSKLSKGEKFEVTTDTALAGVRGTEFVVKAVKRETTKIAVKEGEVSVVPPRVAEKMEEIKRGLATETARETLDGLELPAIIVTEEKEVTLDAGQAEEATREFEEISKEIEKKIKAIDQKASAVETKEREIDRMPEKKAQKEAEKIRQLKEDISELKKSVATTAEKKAVTVKEEVLKKPETTTGEVQEQLKTIETIRPKEVEMVIARKEKAEEKALYTKVTIKVDPKDAVIFVNGEERGRGTIKELYEPGTVLSIRAELQGYITVEREVEVSDEKTQAVSVELKSYTRLDIKVEPEDASIIVAGETKGKGGSSDLYPPGETLEIRAVLDGYVSERRMVTVLDEKKQEVSIQLQRVKHPVTWKLSSGGGKFVRAVVVSKDKIFAADDSGRVFCCDGGGKRLWEVKTENAPNENSIPVVSERGVFFSGQKELLAMDTEKGTVLSKTPVGKGELSSHLFGRSPVCCEGVLVYPSDDSLVFLDERNLSEKRKLPVSGGSNCSPSFWDGKLVIANRNGELLVINPDTGSTEKTIKTGALQPVSLAPTVSGDTCIFAGRKGTVAAVDLKKSRVMWEHKVEKGVFTDITVGDEGAYPFIGDRFYALSLKDGRELFKPVSSTCPPLCHDGVLYYGTRAGQLIAADAASGTVQKRIGLDGQVSAMPGIIGGTIVAATDKGTLYGLNPEDM